MFGRTEAVLVPGQRTAALQIARPAMVKVQVTGYEGTELEGALSVQLRAQGEAVDPFPFGLGGGQSKIGPNGQQTLGPVAPGPYDVLLIAQPPLTCRFIPAH